MKKGQSLRQTIDKKLEVLYFIYRCKAVRVEQIAKMFDMTYDHAKWYLWTLSAGTKKERKKEGDSIAQNGVLKRISIPGVLSGSLYFVSYKGIDFLKEQGYENITRYSVNTKESFHDTAVTDILIYLIKELDIQIFETDFELRKRIITNYKKKLESERIKKEADPLKKFEQKIAGKETPQMLASIPRVPDLMFKDSYGNEFLVEYQMADKSWATLRSYVESYIHKYSNCKVLFTVKASKVDYYIDFFTDSQWADGRGGSRIRNDWSICIFKNNITDKDYEPKRKAGYGPKSTKGELGLIEVFKKGDAVPEDVRAIQEKRHEARKKQR